MKLFPPLFRTGAAILSEKIDALCEQIASILDGGLDADNLAAGFQLPNAAFLENRSLIALPVTIPGALNGTVPVTLVPLGMSMRLVGYSFVCGSPIHSDIRVLKNGVQVDASSFDASLSKSGYGLFTSGAIFAASDFVSVHVPDFDALNIHGNPLLPAKVTLTFDMPHTI